MHHSPDRAPWLHDKPMNRFILPDEISGLARHSHDDSEAEWIAAEEVATLLCLNEGASSDLLPTHWISGVIKARLETYEGQCSYIGGCFSVRSVGFVFASRFPNCFSTEKNCCSPTTSNPKLCSFKAMTRRAHSYIAGVNQGVPTDMTRLMLDCQFQADCVLAEPIVFRTFLASLKDSRGAVRLRGAKLEINRFDEISQKRGRPPVDKDYLGRTVAYRPTKKPTND